MAIGILLFKYHLKFVYFFLKLFKTKKKIVFISRQSDNISLDFKLIIDEIKKRDKNMEIVVLSKKLKKGILNYIKYYFHIYKQMYHLSTSCVCVIDTYVIPVSILKHKDNLKIIQIWHSLAAIKQFGYQTLNKESGRDYKISNLMDMHKNYDYVISGSDEMIKYFSKAFNVDKSKFLSYGLPRLDYLIKNKKLIQKKIYKKYPDLKNKKNILYVPTFRNYKEDSLENLHKSTKFDKVNLIVKLHPSKRFKNFDNRIYTCDEFPSIDLLTVADAVITDYSAIAMEAAIIDVPLYFYVFDYDLYKEKNGLNIDLFKEMSKYTFKDPNSLINVINKKYDFNVLNNFKNKYITNQKGDSAKLITNLIFEVTK